MLKLNILGYFVCFGVGVVCGLFCFGGGFFVVWCTKIFKLMFTFTAYIILYFET